MGLEIVLINGEPFYKVANGTTYCYASIPKNFKPYFEKLQEENRKQLEIAETLKKALDEIEKYMEGRMCEQAIEEGDTYKPETAYIRHITIDTDVVYEIIEKAKKSL